MTPAVRKPLRLLVVLPSWVGDAVMATPALRLLRSNLPGAFIGGLCRPGIDEILAGGELLDELHVERAQGVMGPKHAAHKVRPRMYDSALLFTNSFATALVVRIAGIPRRAGYDRDGRGILLTERFRAPKRPDGKWATIPACEYYWRAAAAFLSGDAAPTAADPLHTTMSPAAVMELHTTTAQEAAADALLVRAGISPGSNLVILNPGGNDPAKRWPADRFAHIAAHLVADHGFTVLVNGAPAESPLCQSIVDAAGPGVISLPALGITLGTLKVLIRRARLMITNDTGPRHIAAAFAVPLISLFGPTDHRWTIIPTLAPEIVLTADPSLPPDQAANDHPDRCRIDRIGLPTVLEACNRLLQNAVT